MKTINKIIVFAVILIASAAYSQTLVWDHDCIDTTGFNVYFSPSSGDNKVKIGSVNCPATSIAISPADGYYTVTAENENGESDFSEILAAFFFNSIKYDYVVNRLLYKGQHTNHDATETDANWVITKYYYGTTGVIIAMRIRTTSWENRAIGW